jgi:hypothetical protein
MQAETEAQLKPAGLLPAWRDLAANGGTEAFSRVVVVQLRGRCFAPAVGWPLSGDDVLSLGATQLIQDGVGSRVRIDCELIRDSVAQFAHGRSEAMGIVLGRVLAHELYHVLVNTRDHDKHGLGRARLTWTELLSARTRFSAAAVERLRRGFAPDQIERASGVMPQALSTR